jgi:hypothetical protein
MADTPHSPLLHFALPADHAPERPAGERVAAILADAGFGDTLPEPAPEMPHVPERRGALESLADLAAPLVASTMYSMTMVTKMAHVIPLTPELAAEVTDTSEAHARMVRFLTGTATPQERAEAAARAAAWKADRERRQAEAIADWEATRARFADSPAVLAVLDIHQPDEERLECQHPYFGWESDAEDWPCSTYEAIKGAVD